MQRRLPVLLGECVEPTCANTPLMRSCAAGCGRVPPLARPIRQVVIRRSHLSLEIFSVERQVIPVAVPGQPLLVPLGRRSDARSRGDCLAACAAVQRQVGLHRQYMTRQVGHRKQPVVCGVDFFADRRRQQLRLRHHRQRGAHGRIPFGGRQQPGELQLVGVQQTGRRELRNPVGRLRRRGPGRKLDAGSAARAAPANCHQYAQAYEEKDKSTFDERSAAARDLSTYVIPPQSVPQVRAPSPRSLHRQSCDRAGQAPCCPRLCQGATFLNVRAATSGRDRWLTADRSVIVRLVAVGWAGWH